MKTQAFNPYLPCYEYIADGEPRVFDGRLYILGSHDKFDGKDYCENDYVTWSAPVDDLSDWRYEGVIFRRDQDPRPGNLYAPDVVQGMDGRYYLYYSKAGTSVIGVAVCDAPAGKYEYLGDVSYPLGNNHGGLVCIRGQWYIFDHRMTNRTLFSRQGVAEPVTIEPDGSIRQAEATSCGLNDGPLRAQGTYPAHIACNLMRGSLLSGCPYLTQDKPDGDPAARQYVAGVRRGSRVGYKYFDFPQETLTLTVQYRCSGTGKLEILQSAGGDAAGSIAVSKTQQWQEGACTLQGASGKNENRHPATDAGEVRRKGEKLCQFGTVSI